MLKPNILRILLMSLFTPQIIIIIHYFADKNHVMRCETGISVFKHSNDWIWKKILGIGQGYCTLNTDRSSFGSVSISYITLACTGRFELFTPLKDPLTPGFSSKECQAIYYMTLACTGRFELFSPLRDPSSPGFPSKECQATLYITAPVNSPSGLPSR